MRRIPHLDPAAIRSIAVVAVLASWLAFGARSARADGDEGFTALRRQVIVSEILIAPLPDFPSPDAMLAVLRRLATRRIEPCDGFWRFHMVAFMDPPPDTAEVWAVLTDVTEPEHPREVKVFELATEPGARALPENSFVLTEAMGFEHGHDYELAVTREGAGSPGGKTAVLARAVVTLK